MKCELHTIDDEVMKFTASSIEDAAQQARDLVLGNCAWIDYVVSNPGTSKASIIDVELAR